MDAPTHRDTGWLKQIRPEFRRQFVGKELNYRDEATGEDVHTVDWRLDGNGDLQVDTTTARSVVV